MKTLEQIKNDYAVIKGYRDWGDFINYLPCYKLEKHMDNICVISQKECLKLASENFIGSSDFAVDTRNAITNENNIIK